MRVCIRAEIIYFSDLNSKTFAVNSNLCSIVNKLPDLCHVEVIEPWKIEIAVKLIIVFLAFIFLLLPFLFFLLEIQIILLFFFTDIIEQETLLVFGICQFSLLSFESLFLKFNFLSNFNKFLIEVHLFTLDHLNFFKVIVIFNFSIDKLSRDNVITFFKLVLFDLKISFLSTLFFLCGLQLLIDGLKLFLVITIFLLNLTIVCGQMQILPRNANRRLPHTVTVTGDVDCRHFLDHTFESDLNGGALKFAFLQFEILTSVILCVKEW